MVVITLPIIYSVFVILRFSYFGETDSYSTFAVSESRFVSQRILKQGDCWLFFLSGIE